MHELNDERPMSSSNHRNRPLSPTNNVRIHPERLPLDRPRSTTPNRKSRPNSPTSTNAYRPRSSMSRPRSTTPKRSRPISPTGIRQVKSADTFQDHGIEVTAVDLEREEEEYMMRLLSRKAMHLPNHSYWGDYFQFMKNNHPLFGCCFHHKLHPLRFSHRLYILMGSIAFGLTVSNVIYILYVANDAEMNKLFVEIAIGDHALNFSDIEALEITYGMVYLLTIGCFFHSAYDISMWYLSACSCFLNGASCGSRGKYQYVGNYIVIGITGILSAVAIYVVLIRAIYEERIRMAGEGFVLNEFDWNEVRKVQSFSFLIGYFIELLLVYFAWYPTLIFLLFNGIFPVIGRDREIKKQYRERVARDKRLGFVDEEYEIQ